MVAGPPAMMQLSALHWWKEYWFPSQPACGLLSCFGKISWHQPQMPLPLAGLWPFVPLIANVKVSSRKSPSWKQAGAGALGCLWKKVSFIYLPCFLASPDIHFGAVRDMILAGKILVSCSTDIFRTQNPVYCVLLHSSLFCPRGVLLILLSSWLYYSIFFNFPSKDRTSDLWSSSF